VSVEPVVAQAPAKTVAEPLPKTPQDLARVAGMAIKDVLLKYHVKPEKTTAIVTHAVKTLLQSESQARFAPLTREEPEAPVARIAQAPRTVQRVVDPKLGGKLSLHGLELPMEQEDVVESMAAGTKDSKMNAETNPALLAYMKSRGLTPNQQS
jgi:hypothetical protein